MRKYLFSFAFCVVASLSFGATITVVNTAENGGGSLADAIMSATDGDSIAFHIPGVGPHIISLNAPLPIINKRIIIDGFSQNEFEGRLTDERLVMLDGQGSAQDGLFFQPGSSSAIVRWLVISGFTDSGIRISGTNGIEIMGCFIGTDPSGNTAVPNNGPGIIFDGNTSGCVIGDTLNDYGNLISGNSQPGIFVNGPNDNIHLFAGNTIGIDRMGMSDLSNGGSGIVLKGNDHTVAANIISGNQATGLVLDGTSGCFVFGNFIGLSLDGTFRIDNMGSGISLENGANLNVVGGTLGENTNVISGNSQHGIRLDAALQNNIEGNIIGLDPTGNFPIGNLNEGVLVFNTSSNNIIGSNMPQRENFISGNGGSGVVVSGTGTSGNQVLKNVIGIGNGGIPAGNLNHGVAFVNNARSNKVGSRTCPCGNEIAYNGGSGILVENTSAENELVTNQIWENGVLGIDLGFDNVTVNDPAPDADVGANNLQNYPKIIDHVFIADSIILVGELASEASTQYRIEFFGNQEGHPSGFGEGEHYLGFIDVLTGPGGVANFQQTFYFEGDSMYSVTATSLVSNAEETSEFSPNYTVKDGAAPGGLEGDLTIWFQADYGPIDTTGNVDAWINQASGNIDFLLSTGPNLFRYEDEINYQPAVYFSGDALQKPFVQATDFLSPNGNTIFVVSNNSGSVLQEWSSSSGTSQRIEYSFPSLGMEFGGNSTIGSRSVDMEWVIFSGFNRPSGDSTFINGLLDLGNVGGGLDYNAHGLFSLGADTALVNSFFGSIAEFIVFNDPLEPLERKKVETYLAIKYGVGLDQTVPTDYVAPDGSILYPATSTHAAYFENIAGIGKDSLQHLDKTLSTSADSGRVIMQAGTGLDEQEYLLWGANDLSMDSLTTVNNPTGLSHRLAREWRVAETGDVGLVDVFFAFDFDKLPTSDTTKIQLMQSAAADFIGATLSNAGVVFGDTVAFFGVDFSDGEFFSLALDLSGPGGIGQDLALWLKSDEGVFNGGSGALDGQNVNVWEDLSGARTNDLTDDNLMGPIFLNNAEDNINGYPVVYFDSTVVGLDLGSDHPFVVGGGYSFIAVARPLSDGTQNYIVDFGQAPSDGTGMSFSLNDFAGYSPIAHGGNTINSPESVEPQPAIVRYFVDFFGQEELVLNGQPRTGTTNALSFLGNGQVLTQASRFTNSGPFTLGAQAGDQLIADRHFIGDLAEFIMYDDSKSPMDFEKVETYLALKYGIAYEGLYVDSEGDILWDQSNHDEYNDIIAGIGLDILSGFDQPTSASSHIDASLKVSAESPINDLDYLIWGANGAPSGSATSENAPPGFEERLGRVWTVEEYGETDDLTLQFYMGNVLGHPTDPSAYALMIDVSDDFSAPNLITINASYADDTLSFTNVNLSAGEFFTVAFGEPVAFGFEGPGGVGQISAVSNLNLWLRSDEGVFQDAGITPAEDGSPVAEWHDQSGSGILFAQPTAVNQPSTDDFGPNGMRQLKFDGTDDALAYTGLGEYPKYTAYYIMNFNGVSPSNFSSIMSTNGDLENGVSTVITNVNGPDHFATMLDEREPALIEFNTTLAPGSAYMFRASDNGSFVTHYTQDFRFGSDTLEANAFKNFQDGHLGAWQDPGFTLTDHLDGSISEVILFGEQLDTIHTILVENYLAAKYGLNLSTHDYYTRDESGNGDFDFDVAGIGMYEGVAHEKARGTGPVQVETPDDLQDFEFLFWGGDDLPLDSTQSTDVPAGFNGRFSRVWSVNELGEVGQVRLGYFIGNVTDLPTDPADFGLALGGSPAPGGNPVIAPTSLINDTLYFDGINLSDGDYFALAFNEDASPVAENDTLGPITPGIQDFLIDVLVNDFDTNNDIDTSSLSILTPPVFGMAAVDGSFLIEYDSDLDNCLLDSLEYVIFDLAGNSDTAWVFIATTVSSNSPSVSFSGQTSLCSGDTATYSIVDSSFGGSDPSFEWYINGASVEPDSNHLFTSGLLDMDSIAVVMTSSSTCFSPMTDTVSLIVSVTPSPVAGAIFMPEDTLCAGELVNVVLSGYSGSIMWQDSSGAGTWQTLAGAVTDNEFFNPILSNSPYRYRAIVSNGVCFDTTESSLVLVQPSAVAGTISGGGNICPGDVLNLTLTGETGTIQWQKDSTGSFGDLIGESGNTLNDFPQTPSDYRAIVTNGECTDTTLLESVNVFPPVVGGTVSSDATICPGETVSLSLSGDNGSTYQWYVDSTGSFVAISGETGTTHIASPLQNAMYGVEVISSFGCNDSSSLVTITVEPPAIPGTVGGGTTICPGELVTLNLTGETGTIQWQKDSVGSFVNLVGETGNTVVDHPMVNANYRVIVTNGSCEDTSNVELVFVNPPAVAGIVSGGTTICEGELMTLTLTGETGTIQWQKDSSGAYADVVGATGNTLLDNPFMTSNYRAIVTNGSCEDTTNVEIATVAPPAIPGTVSGGTTLCAGEEVTLTVAGETGTIQWQKDSVGTYINLPGETGNSLTDHPMMDANYRVLVTNGSCTDISNFALVVVNAPAVAGIVSGGTTICEGELVTLTVTGETGTIQWQKDSSGAYADVVGATGNTLLDNPFMTSNYRAIVTNGSCEDTTNVEIATVAPPGIPGTVSGGTTLCAGEEVTLTVAGETGTIQWQKDSVGTYINLLGETGNSLTDHPMMDANYRVLVTNGSCTDISNFELVVVNTPAVAGTIAGGTTICEGEPVTLTLTGETGIIQWQKDSVGVFEDIPGGTANAFIDHPRIDANYRAVVSNGGCSDTSNTESVTLNPSVIGGTSGADQTVCFGATATITLSGDNGTAYQWEVDTTGSWLPITGGTFTTLTTNALQSANYRVEVTSVDGCVGYSDTMAVVMEPEVVSGTLGADQTVCQGESANLTLVGDNGSTYQWEVDSTGTWVTILGATTNTFSSINQQNADYRVQVTTASGCNGYSDTLTVFVNPGANAGILNGVTTLCSGESTSITVTGETGSIQWQKDSTSGYVDVIGATGNVLADAPRNDAEYRVIALNGICSDTSDVISVTVNPAAMAGTIAPTPPICSDDTTSLLLTGFQGTIKWEKDSTNGFAPLPGNADPRLPIASDMTADYRAIVTNGSCQDTSAVFTLVVDPEAQAGVASVDAQICEGDNTTLSITTSVGDIQWQRNSGLGFSDLSGVTNPSEVVSPSAALSSVAYRAIVTNGNCVDTSNTVNLRVDSLRTPVVQIAENVNPICAGEPFLVNVTDTAYAGTPVFSWSSTNGESFGDLSSVSFLNLNDQDTVIVQMESDFACLSVAQASDTVIASVITNVVPSLQIAVDNPNACENDAVLAFVADSTGSDGNASFTWFLNGIPQAVTADSLEINEVTPGDSIALVMGNLESCASQSSDTASLVINVTALQNYNVFLNSDSTEICTGSNVNFNTLVFNGGAQPTYEWFVNNVPQGINQTTFNSTSLNDGDVVHVVLTPDLGCPEKTSDTAQLEIGVLPFVTPVIELEGDTLITRGETADFYVSSLGNEGDAPTYAWFVNDTLRGIDSTITIADLTDGAVVKVELQSNARCLTQNGVTDAATMTVLIGNVAPEAFDDSFAGLEDEQLIGLALLNDTDINGDKLQVTNTPVIPPSHGILTMSSNGSFLYAPEENFFGTDTFRYEVCDAELCDTAQVILTIDAVNDLPTTNEDTLGVLQESTAELQVLTNDTDLENRLDSSTVLLLTNNAVGAFSFDTQTGNLTADYTAATGFFGRDSIQYAACDLDGGCDTAWVKIQVYEVLSELVNLIDDQGFDVDESTDPGSNLDSIQVSAPDSLEGQLEYSIVSGNDDSTFTIDEFGLITLTKPLSIRDQAGYNLTVAVSSRENPDITDTAVVTIILYAQIYPEVYIEGTESAPENSLTSYQMLPVYAFYEYEWSSSDTSLVLLDTQGQKVDLAVSEGSPGGTLQVIVRALGNEVPIDTVFFDITVTEGKDFNLTELECPPSATDLPCAGYYLNGFEMSALNNAFSGCSPSGYRDYSSSAYTTELFLGDVYDASVTLSTSSDTSTKAFIGLWIDYDNNGDFDGVGEFVYSTSTTESEVTLVNVAIENNQDYLGARRLRVRVREEGEFNSEDACSSGEAQGETEDYLVVLSSHERLQGPQVLTPNGDGKNDFFVLRSVNSTEFTRLTIFDRQGNVHFDQEDYENDWGGTDEDGNPLPTGTYFYHFTNGENVLKGFFDLNY